MEYLGEMDGEYKLKLIYRNKLTDIRFVHDFLGGELFAKDFDRVSKKYARRIERFYTLCKKSRRILFVWMDYPVAETAVLAEELKKSYAILCKVNPQAEVAFLYLHNKNGVALNSRISEWVAPGVLKMQFEYADAESDRCDAVQRKVLKKLFSKIKLSMRHLTFADMLRRYRIFYVKKNEKGVASVRLFRIPIWKYRLK